jgi:glutathione S-transferase
MKLYFSPGACSLASHIALNEADLEFEAVQVGRDKKAANGEDYWTVTAKGYVPALRLDDGSVLTEGTAILPYVADRKPAANLAPPAGTIERYRMHEWLGYFKKFDFLEKSLAAGGPYLLGTQYTVADSYAFVVLGWTRVVGIDLSKWPTLKAYHERIGTRPAVVKAMKAEGLLK